MNNNRLMVKLAMSDRKSTFTDSLSFRGRTIASSYFKEAATAMIPATLIYTEKVPNVAGEKRRLSTG
jgi:hypothetical protein